MRLSALHVNGEMTCLEVMRETTGREIEQQIKEGQLWDDDTRRTTEVKLVIVGERLLGSDETVADAGLTADAVVNVVFKQQQSKMLKQS